MRILSKRQNLFLVIVLLLIIVTLSLLLRIHSFSGGNFYFLLDQARDMTLVKEIVENRDITLIGARSGIGGIFHGPLWLYLLVPTFVLSGGNPYFTLVPIFILLTVILVLSGFYIGWKLYGAKYGLLIALFLGISSSFIESMANFSNAHVMPLIFLFFLYTLIRYLRGYEKALIGSAFLIGIGIHFEAAFAIFLIPITLLTFVWKRKFPQMKTLFKSTVVFFITVINYVLFELKNGFIMTRAALNLILGHSGPMEGYEQYSDVFFRINDRVSVFVNSFFTPLFTQTQLSKVLLIIIIISSFVFTLIHLKKKKREKDNSEFLFLLLIPLIISALLVIYPHPIWPHYILPLVISSVFLLVLGMKIISKHKLGHYYSWFALLIFLIPTLGWIDNTYIKGYSVPLSNGATFQKQLEVVDWVLNDAGNEKFGYLAYTPQVLTYNMDYLMWWRSRDKGVSHYVNNKERITYLLLLPPKEGDLKAHDFWKKNVIRTNGKVIERKVFSTGLMVEKLEISKQEPPVESTYFHGALFR